MNSENCIQLNKATQDHTKCARTHPPQGLLLPQFTGPHLLVQPPP